MLPRSDSPQWDEVMKHDPYDLRKRAFDGEHLSPHEIGRAIYHLAQRRHFKGRDIDEISDEAEVNGEAPEETKITSARKEIAQALKQEGKTLGAWLSERRPHERKRGHHAIREVVEEEFDCVWLPLLPEEFRKSVRDAIFAQRPVFWRLNTIVSNCRFVPGARLCPKGSWLSQQRRMLEKLNNLSLVGGNQRPLDAEERGAILSELQTKASVTWPGVRRALGRLYRSRGAAGTERSLRFNLEEGGEPKLIGNTIEAKLADIFGQDWQSHPHRQEIRDAVPEQIWNADYGDVNGQRVVIRPAAERSKRRDEVASWFIAKFGLSEQQAAKVKGLKLPTGWEPYSREALQAMLPHLNDGERFGEIINGPDWENWRDETFPDRELPTGEVVDRLPSPAHLEESRYISGLRNPTVVRTRNELRKVVNNLIEMFGKPDLIRVELARDVGNSKRERDEKAKGSRRLAIRREKARIDLAEKGIIQPTRADIEKWMLWEECQHRCPYTGDSISFNGLFRTGEFEVEHIWPRSRSLDDSFRNKTLCRRDVNAKKGNRTPFELFGDDQEEWTAIVNRLNDMRGSRTGVGMSRGKIRRFLANSIPEGFRDRQLNDTGYAAREAVAYLKKLWPDSGNAGPVRVFAVAGRVTAHVRRLWGLNNILAHDGEKTRANHRHHAVDALVVACCNPGLTQRLSRYWQEKDAPRTQESQLLPPWKTIRIDAKNAVEDIIVSHRVRRKISGRLHEETVYGDTGMEETATSGPTYRYIVTRKDIKSLSKTERENEIRDAGIRAKVQAWANRHAADYKKDSTPYPKHGRRGAEIRRVRLLRKLQMRLMARSSTGYSKLGNNHHIAIYEQADGKVRYEVVSLLEASKRLARRNPIVRRDRNDGARFVMSLSAGDSLELTRDSETKILVVEGVWASGQVVMVDHDDATGATRFRPRATTIMSSGAKKLSVDPIGRIRPAND